VPASPAVEDLAQALRGLLGDFHLDRDLADLLLPEQVRAVKARCGPLRLRRVVALADEALHLGQLALREDHLSRQLELGTEQRAGDRVRRRVDRDRRRSKLAAIGVPQAAERGGDHRSTASDRRVNLDQTGFPQTTLPVQCD
jgi:hypothetical protein